MAKQTINIGTSANDGTGSTLRAAFDITNDNFTELYDGTGGLLHKIEGTNFTGSLLIGHSTTGTLSAAIKNTGVGLLALDALTSGDSNTAIGYNAGSNISSGNQNVIVGTQAGDSLTSGGQNIAIGMNALSAEDGHGRNVAIGHSALENLNAGTNANNVAIGYLAGIAMSTGTQNTIIGSLAGDAIQTGQDNTVLGYNAATSATGNNNTFIGSGAGSNITGGTNNTMIGKDTDLAANASNSIVIGSGAGSGSIGSNTIVFGDSNITDVIIPSDSTLKIGADSDLQIEHVSSNSFIKNTAVGDLYIENQVDDKDIIFRCDDGSGGLTEYFKLDGSIAGGGFAYTRFPDNSTIAFGTGSDLQIRHDGNNSIVENSVGDLRFTNKADDKDIIFQTDDGSGGTTTYFKLDGSSTDIQYFKDLLLADNVKLNVGNSDDMEIYHDGSHSYIHQKQTGDLYIQQSVNDGDILFQSDDGSGGMATYFRLDGGERQTSFSEDAVFADSKRLMFGAGGDLQILHNATDSSITNTTGDLEIIQNADDKDIILKCDNGSGGNTPYLTLNGFAVRTDISQNIRAQDNIKIQAGSSGDLWIYHDGTNSEITNLTGNLNIKNSTTNGNISFFGDNGAGGTTEYFRVDGGDVRTIFSKEARFLDAAALKIGSSGDLALSHDGSNTRIENFTGALKIIQNTDDGDIEFFCDDGSGGIIEYFKLDGSDTNVRFSKDIKLSDGVLAMFGSNNDLLIFHDGTDSVIQNNTGNLELQNRQDDGDIVFKSDDGSGGVTEYFRVDGGDERVNFSKNAGFSDNVRAMFGDGLDLRIYHNSTTNANEIASTNSRQLQLKQDNLFIGNQAGTETIISAVADSAVELYYDNSKKFETTSTGINIQSVPEHADNSAASTAGLAVGDVYRTGDFLKIRH